MDQPDHGAEPKFTRPLRQILTMLIVLGLVGVGVFSPCRRCCRSFWRTFT